MRRLVLLAAVLVATPAAAQSNDDAGLSAVYLPVWRNATAKEVLATLDRVCASNRRADQRRCADAWRIINEGAARLRAARSGKG